MKTNTCLVFKDHFKMIDNKWCTCPIHVMNKVLLPTNWSALALSSSVLFDAAMARISSESQGSYGSLHNDE